MTNTQSPAPGVAAEREKFEAWYIKDAAKAQVFLTTEEMINLRDGNSYGEHRVMLNEKWAVWQACTALQASAAAVPVGWALVTNNGKSVAWHNTIHRDDPSIGGFSTFPQMANNSSPDDAPHRWVQVFSAPPLPAQVQAAVDDDELIEGCIESATGKHRVLNSYDYEDVFAACKAVLASRTPAPGMARRRLKDQEILDWAARHDMRQSLSELRCIADDAASIAQSPAPQAAGAVEHRPNCAMGRQARCDCDYQERKAAAIASTATGRAGS